MYQFFRSLGFKKMLQTEVPAFCLSLLIAEIAYKFGSFIFECLAFLATWFVLGWIASLLQAKK